MTDEPQRRAHRSTSRKNPVRSDAEKMIEALRKETIERIRRARQP